MFLEVIVNVIQLHPSLAASADQESSVFLYFIVDLSSYTIHLGQASKKKNTQSEETSGWDLDNLKLCFNQR